MDLLLEVLLLFWLLLVARATLSAMGKFDVKSSKLKFNFPNSTNADNYELVATVTTPATIANQTTTDVRGNRINMIIIDSSNLLSNLSSNNEISSINFQPFKVHTNYDDLLTNKITMRISDSQSTANGVIFDINESNHIKSSSTSKIITNQTATTMTKTTFENENHIRQTLASSSSQMPKSLEFNSSKGTIRKESKADGATVPSPSLKLPFHHSLSRSKRYLSFPEGSSFSVAVCMTVGIIGNPHYSYMSYGLNWAVAYDLPNATWTLNRLKGFPKESQPEFMWQRRTRRSLYHQIENFISNMGYNGRPCILRALCESRQYFTNTNKEKMNMLGEMLKTLFSLPKQRLHRRELKENSALAIYDRAYRYADLKTDCSRQYDCSFSLLALAVGLYSTPPQNFFKHH